jgi:hypothetical protein
MSPSRHGSFETHAIARQTKVLHGISIGIIRAEDVLLWDAGDGGVHALLEPLDILRRPLVGGGLAERLD